MSEGLASASCGCGAVTLRLGREIYTVFNCHCQDCRRHNASAYSSYVVSNLDGFNILTGSEFIASYQKPPSTKYFCSQCGTPLYNCIDSYPNIRLCYLGTLENCEEYTPRMNVWCQNQLAWVTGIGDLKNYPKNSD